MEVEPVVVCIGWVPMEDICLNGVYDCIAEGESESWWFGVSSSVIY
jgi:hypothetical protein